MQKKRSTGFNQSKSPNVPNVHFSKKIGLPKIGTGGNQTNKKNYKVSKPRDTKFMPLNATNVALVKDYFNQIHSQLYDLLAQSNQFVLYQFEGQEYEIFLIPVSMSKYIKRFTHEEEIKYAGIHLGYMRRHQTKTGFARGFYLSYEGEEFPLRYIDEINPC